MGGPGPLPILRGRFARGEITDGQCDRMKAMLKE